MKNSWLPSVPAMLEGTRPATSCANRLSKGGDLLLRLLVQFGRAHDAASADILARELELRFDQRQDHTVWS